MKKLTLALILGLLVFSYLHAQQPVVIERTGVLSDLASAVGTIIALPLATVEGITVGTVEAAGSLIHGSTQIVVAPPARIAPAPIIVAPTPVMVRVLSDHPRYDSPDLEISERQPFRSLSFREGA